MYNWGIFEVKTLEVLWAYAAWLLHYEIANKKKKNICQ